MLPHSQDGPYDAAPTSDAVGLRVGMVIDGQLRYGRVTYVDGRKVRVQFERKLGNRHSITVNWEGLRIAKEQTTPPPPPPRPHVDPERIAHLRAIIDSQLPPHFEDTDRHDMEHSALALYTALQEHIRELDIMRQRIHALVTDYNDHRERCLAMGIRSTPPPIEVIRDIEVRATKKLADRKRHLSSLRDRSRAVLGALLVAAGEEGATSEEIIATLCIGQITPHRIMGTLSAFSRARQAILQPNGRWKAT